MRKNNKKLKSAKLILVMILIYSLCTITYVLWVRGNINKEISNYLAEVSKQSAKTIKTQVQGDFETIEAMANFIGSQEVFDLESSLDLLRKEVKAHAFKRMGIILPNGEATMTDGSVCDFSDREYFKAAMNGKTTISGRLIDKIDGKYINVYGTPVYDGNNRVIAVLFATHDTRILKRLLEIPTFDDEGYSYIVESGGAIVIDSRCPTCIMKCDNVFETLEDAKINKRYRLKSMHADMNGGGNGQILYSYKGNKNYLNYTSIGINNWYMISIIPEIVTSKWATRTIGTTLLASGFTILMFGYLIFYISFIQRNNKKALEKMAFIDPLTGDFNWNKFKIVGKELLQRNWNQDYVFIILDIDKFKVINDMFGHEKGNELLRYIAKVLDSNLQNEEAFTRVSADTYAILLSYKDENEIISRIKLIERLVDQNEFCQIVLSFGIYKITDKNIEIGIMSDRANLARQTIKQRADKTYAFYTDAIRYNLLEEKKIEDEMEKALFRKEFKLYVQPKYSFFEEKIIGAEALVRWSHPQKGIIFPDKFIPIFERNGFIKKLDNYMYKEVCKALSRYKDIFADQGPITLSVNLSRINLSNITLAEELYNIAEQYNVDIDNIEIELTENSMFNNRDEVIWMIERLKDKGFKIAIDDFGTGYSSLNSLKEMQADVLKIDREFLDESMDNERGRDIIESIIYMAKKLNLTTVAEGVENVEQVNVLREMGCDIAQGYYYAKPMPIAEFIELINVQKNTTLSKVE